MVGVAMGGFCLAPFAGPVLWRLLIEKMSWNWTMWVLLMFARVTVVLIATLAETYKPILLKRRAKKRGLPLPPKLPTGEALKLVVMMTLQRPFAMLLTEPIVRALSVYMALVFAVLFGFFEAIPYVFTSVYGFHPGDTGLTFLGIGVGLLIGAAIFMFLDRTNMSLLCVFQCHRRLNPDCCQQKSERWLSLPIGLFWLAW
ncbi:putative mfs multidrug transporter protein [Lipomyces kononenkoae]|uniref:Mfs multidrug transporter protein n=1 Tax=Lipomyces kononenkoae TaxID=34357 RepID=A0ACC3SZE4_LIPKO